MIEILVVIVIIAILGALSYPAYTNIVRVAHESNNVHNLRQITNGTLLWAADHGDKLPSPLYSGTEPDLPTYWKLKTDGQEGLWLNGVIYAQLYLEDDASPDVDLGGNLQEASAGGHLIGTVFQSEISNFGEERNFFKHSFAMNANLMYDQLAILRDLENPWYSEKSLSKFVPTSAMIYIDCAEPNVVMAEDIGAIRDTSKIRYDGKRVTVAYLDGHVKKTDIDEIPDRDVEADREASLFWRGVMPDR
ncbi:MAG: hypothetical protein KDN19_12415 [Verrucomicrobiae bacterium]|nr:hypothetical protein [Verrucomicrobiae bacterium]